LKMSKGRNASKKVGNHWFIRLHTLGTIAVVQY